MEKYASFSIIIIVIFNCYLTANSSLRIEGLTKRIHNKTIYYFLVSKFIININFKKLFLNINL